MAIKCCKNCEPPKRHLACHGTCPEYKQEKAEHEARREAERARRDVSHELYAYRIKNARTRNNRPRKR